MTTTRTAILHADDVGMCHGSNAAFIALARAGAIDCGSLMVPCPWLAEIAHVAAADPTLDLGVHLTLTSEWISYRWGPVGERSPAAGLTDAEGVFHRDVPSLRRDADPRAVEEECAAQIERALACGVDPTHLDTHMGAALVPEFLTGTLRLAERFQLPLLLPRRIETYLGVLRMGALDASIFADAARHPWVAPIDRFAMTPGHAPSRAEETYRHLLDTLAPGVTYVALHPNQPGDIEVITAHHPRAQPHWRTDEAALFGSGRPAQWLADAGIGRLGMRPFRDEMRAAHGAGHAVETHPAIKLK
jgi:predicted glycoside hydrolase/deacetylase ChbG (UPF0249 family)